MSNSYSFDHITNTLTVTAAFLKKAGILNSAEYKIIKDFRADNPDMKIVKAESSKKNVKHHIKMAQMVQFITVWDSKNKTTYLDQYETVKALSKIQASPYKYVEVWFQKTFPNWQNQVDFNNDGTMSFVTKSDEQKKTDAPTAAAPAENQANNIATLDKAA